MAEGRGHNMDDEPLFRFENDEEEAAVMDQLLIDGDMDADPVTPYGSAEPSAPSAAAHTGRAGAASGRLHLSSAQVWQNPDHSSPPPLTYSPSPRTTSSFQHRHQDAPRQQRQRYSSRRDSTQHQHQPSRQGSAHGLDQNFHALSSPISDLSLRQQSLDQQQADHRVRRRRPSYDQDPRNLPSKPRNDHEEELEDHVPHQRPSYVVDPRQVRSGSRNDYEDPDLAAPQDLRRFDDRAPHRRSSCDTEPRHVHSANLIDHQEPERQPLRPVDDQEYELIPEDEVLEMMYNGDEESRITAQKFRDQIVHAVVQNGRVGYMVVQATAEWWRSPEMTKRKRAAGRKAYEVSSQVVSGAGHVILTSTPVGRVYDSVSTNINAFKAAPFSYTMQGLGVMKKRNSGTAPALPSTNMDGRKSPEDLMALSHGRESGSEPAIADEDGFGSEFDEDSVIGMGMFDEN